MPNDIDYKINLPIPLSLFRSKYDNGYDGGQPNFGFNNVMPYGNVLRLLYMYATEEEFPSKASAPLFCPTVFDGSRAMLNATVSGMLVLDSDGMIQLGDVVQMFRSDGLEAIIYSSASNQNGDRMRIAVPLTETIDAVTYIKAVLALTDYVGTLNPKWKAPNGGLDRSKLNPWSMFYVPGQYKCVGDNQFHYVEGMIGSAKDWIETYPQPVEPLPAPRPKKPVTQVDDEDERRAKCRACLAVISPDIGRDQWLNVGKILKDEFGEGDGFGLWDEWSSGSSKYRRREMAAVWRSFRRPGVVTIGTLFKYADNFDRTWRKPFIKVIDHWGHLKGYDSVEEMRADFHIQKREI
jgi:hypothetical protein